MNSCIHEQYAYRQLEAQWLPETYPMHFLSQ